MKKAFSLAILVAAGLGLAFSVGGRGDADSWREGKAAPPFGLGQKVAGAWLYVIDFGNGPFEGELQLFADGNFVMNNTVINEGNNHLTTAMGAWKQTGKRSVVMTALVRIVNPNGELYCYEKIVGEATIEGKVLSGNAAGFVYLPGMDPLDPDETAVEVFGPSSFTGKRIGVEKL